MRVCYLDEAGCPGTLPAANSPIQPVFVPVAVVFEQARLHELTLDFLQLKGRFFPNLMPSTGHYLDRVLAEIKGAEIRRNVCSDRRRVSRQAIGFLDRFVELLEEYDARLMGRIIVKPIGRPLRPRAIYTTSVQAVCATFQNLLITVNDHGWVIADSRRKPQNAIVAHSIFTQKFTTAGDQYDRILEMPTFGHSENHVGLQIADLLCSALFFPMASFAYCTGHVNNVHVQPGYGEIRARYGPRLRKLQHRYHSRGRHCGGVAVSDRIARRPTPLLFV